MADRHVDYLLIGGGLAAGNCARWLRESGADGAILLVGREPDVPYNRPPCSKGYLQGTESRADTLFRPAEWFEQQQVEVLTRVSVMKLDPAERTVSLSKRGSTCTMVMLEPEPLSRHFGQQAGRFFRERLEEHGVTVHGDDEIDR